VEKEDWDMKTMHKLMLAGGSLALSLSFPATAFAQPVMLNATLSGANETKPGDPDGSGSFAAEVEIATGDVCYTLDVSDIGEAMAAHIHKGIAGKDGKPVASLQVTGPDDDLCMAMEPTLLEKIAAAPGAYYVNVHTKDFPAGAIRGQFDGPATPPKKAEAAPAEAGGEAAPAEAPAEAAPAEAPAEAAPAEAPAEAAPAEAPAEAAPAEAPAEAAPAPAGEGEGEAGEGEGE
jgi:hypothetical protein